jgi:hypothetical protein
MCNLLNAIGEILVYSAKDEEIVGKWPQSALGLQSNKFLVGNVLAVRADDTK